MIKNGGIRIKRVYKGTGIVYQDPVASSMSLSDFSTAVKSGNSFFQSGTVYGSTYSGTLTIVGTGLDNASIVSSMTGGTVSLTNANATSTRYTATITMNISASSAVASFDMDGYILVVEISNTPSTVSSISLSGLDSVSGSGYTYTQSGTISDRTYSGTLTISGQYLVNTLTNTDSNCTTTFGTPSTNTSSSIVVPVTIVMGSSVEQCSTVIKLGDYKLTVTLNLQAVSITSITINGELLNNSDNHHWGKILTTYSAPTSFTIVVTGTGLNLINGILDNYNMDEWGTLLYYSPSDKSDTQVVFTIKIEEIKKSYFDYLLYSNKKDILGSITVTIKVSTPSTGVYYHKTDGTVESTKSSSNNNDYDGVVVSDGTHAFVIGKNSGGAMQFGGYGTDISNTGILINTNSSTAQTDFVGDSNTTALIEALGSSAVAATWCRTQFDGKGYLPALGEWKLAYDNKSAVNTAMSNIGGTAIPDSYNWSSTLYDASSVSWGLYWVNGTMDGDYRGNGTYVRAFCAL